MHDPQLPMHNPEINPESFVLYDDDDWFPTIAFFESQPEELSDDQHTNDPTDETDGSADSVRKYFIFFYFFLLIS